MPGQHYSHMGWEDHPDGLRAACCASRLHEDHRVPDPSSPRTVRPSPDVLSPEGRVDDPARLRYLQGHLAVVAEAIEAGVPLSAHLVWSLMDNFGGGGAAMCRALACCTWTTPTASGASSAQRRLSTARWPRPRSLGAQHVPLGPGWRRPRAGR